MPAMTRRTFLGGVAVGASAGLTLPTRTAATMDAPLPYTGINLAGADFGPVPGVHGREYLYPDLANARYYADLGFNLIRLPFKWERLEPELGGGFNGAEQQLLTSLVGQLTDSGLHVILDPHNYAKRRVESDAWKFEHMIGSDQVPATRFADFWARLARLFASDERVMLGLMNEPAGISVDAWLPIANEAIEAIRGVGATNLILVPGVDYSGAHSWIRVGNGKMAGVRDPRSNFAFDVHQYFDHDSSGTSPQAVSRTIGSERIQQFQRWARENGFKAILAEFNGGRNETSLAALHDICREMAANRDVWLGWAAWAGGPRWPQDDMFNLEPTHAANPREQTRVLAQFAQKA